MRVGTIFHQSMKSKLMLWFAIILLIPSCLIGGLSYQTAKNRVYEQFTQQAGQSVQLFDSTIIRFIEPIMQDMDYLEEGITSEAMEDGNPSIKTDVLLPFTKKHPEISTMDIGLQSGFYLNAVKDKMEDGYDHRARPWYQDAMKDKGKLILTTSPYVSKTTGDFVIGFEKAIQDGSGVLHGEVKVNTIADIAKEIKIGDSGYVEILDIDSKWVYHPTNKIGTEFKGDTRDKMFASDHGAFSYISADSQTKNMVFVTNPLTEWKLAGTWYKQEVTQASKPIFNKTLLILVISLLSGAVIVYFIVRSISAPLQRIIQVSENMSHGDLTEQIEVRSKDELGQLASSFNNMSASLRAMIRSIGETAHQLAASSEQLSASAEQSSKASEQISTEVQEVAMGSEKQVASALDANQVVTEISRGMDQTAASIQTVADSSETANEKAAVGNKLVLQTVAQMSEVQDTVNQLAQVVLALGNKTKEIDQIVGLITQIASQTNLLALNAAIEAARAGEHGRGFVVVADEVRKLAEQSGKATDQIRQLIGEIQSESDKAMSSMNQGTEVVRQGISMVKQTGDSFHSIVRMIQEISGQSQEVAAIVEEVNASSQSMVQAMEAISHIAVQSSGNTQHVAAAAEEQTASMQEITASASSLSKMAEELQKVVEKFKV